MNTYKGFCGGKECVVVASSLYSAKQKAIKKLGVYKKNYHMVSVVLVEKDGESVTHLPLF